MFVDKTKGPKIRSTEKSETFQIKDIVPFKEVSSKFKDLLSLNNVQYKRIGNLDRGKYYKYMSLETALLCLKNKTLRFVEPSMWEDKYESRFYNANYENVLNDANEMEVCPIIYSNCFTCKKNNEAAWKIYTYGKNGLGARCVEFMLNKTKLREQLIRNLNNCTIYEGRVSYIWEEDINTLHQKKIRRNKGEKAEPNLWYNLFFSNFTQKEYYNLMLLKRDAFEHEQEFRIMIVPNTPGRVKGKKHKKNGKDQYGTPLIIDDSDVKIDWGQIIQEVRYDDSCTETEIQLLNEAVKKAIEFHGTDDEWKKEKRCPKCYPVYGIRKKIKIQKK